MGNREVMVGIALGQFQSPAFLPGKSNLGLIVFKKKILKPLFEFFLCRRRREKDFLNPSEVH